MSPLIHYFDKVSSTLDTGRQLALLGRLDVWDSLLAKSQREGRGQMRRQWQSPPGNIYAALRLPMVPPFDSTVAALALGALFAHALRNLGYPVSLKWPNDLVIIGKNGPAKIGGILLEESGACLIAGIGINVASAPSSSEMRADAAMPAQALGQLFPTPPLDRFWRLIVKEILKSYKSREFFAHVWKDMALPMLLWLHQPVIIEDGVARAKGLFCGLNEDGAAVLQNGEAITPYLSGSMKADMDASDITDHSGRSDGGENIC